jgi:hypothetical protein
LRDPGQCLGHEHEEVQVMSHSTLAAIIIPVVALIALAVWITLVYRADRHSGTGRRVPRLRHEVGGGSFESRGGGRQVMPRRDATPPEAAQYEPHGEGTSGSG